MPTSAAIAIPSPEICTLDSVIATDRLVSRRVRKPRWQEERAAFLELTYVAPRGRDKLFDSLAALGLVLCSAGTAGVSVLEGGSEGGIFRWNALAGELAQFVGGSTPRNWSPCGTCLDVGKPVLYSYPARYFTYFAELTTPIVEGLVVPVFSDGNAVATIWIVSHDTVRQFDAEDVRIMVSLAKFAGAALPTALAVAPRPGGFSPVGRDREEAWKDYISQIAHNDETALEDLFRECRPLVFATALRIVSFASDAEEVTLDVCKRIWISAHRYHEDRGSVVTWIISIARNLAFDYLRVRARVPGAGPDSCFNECRSFAIDSEQHCMLQEQRSLLVRALVAINAEQAQVIKLAFFSGLSHSEIAERLGEPLGTIKTRIRNGLLRLRSLLAAAA